MLLSYYYVLGMVIDNRGKNIMCLFLYRFYFGGKC